MTVLIAKPALNLREELKKPSPDRRKVLQHVHYQTGEVATGTTISPYDDTIPQNTEGTQFLSLAITPTSATSILHIEANIHVSPVSAYIMTAALFVGATPDALASSMMKPTISYSLTPMFIAHEVVAGVTSELTFKVRCGAHAATATTINGVNSARKHGGVMVSSITITEYAA